MGRGVGAAAVQLAHVLAGRVTALACAQHAAALTDLGATQVLDCRETRPEQLGPFDVIVDTVGIDLAHYRRRLTPGGRMVTVELCGPAIAAIAASIVHGPRRVRTFSANPHTTQLNDVAEQVASGALRPVVNGVHLLDDVASAHRAFAEGGALGRQVVTITQP